jgi:hypothetical protein
VKKVQELMEKQRDNFTGLRDLSPEDRRKKFEEIAKANDKALADILKPEQMKRTKQISLQVRGGRAFADPEVVEALKFTAEQKDKIKAIQEEAQKEMRDLFQGGNREEARKKIAELRKSTDAKLNELLNTEQKAKWKELTGEPFKGELTRPGFGGGSGGQGRRPKKG